METSPTISQLHKNVPPHTFILEGVHFPTLAPGYHKLEKTPVFLSHVGIFSNKTCKRVFREQHRPVYSICDDYNGEGNSELGGHKQKLSVALSCFCSLALSQCQMVLFSIHCFCFKVSVLKMVSHLQCCTGVEGVKSFVSLS